jgi:putative endonuclease
MSKNSAQWLVYILRCEDGSLYTGITTDLEKRLKCHRSGKGAKYLRGKTIRETCYLEEGHTRSSATKREMAIKKLSRDQKMELVSSFTKPQPT